MSRQRIVIVTGDPIGVKMAGPAIRAWNIASELAKEHDVRLLSMIEVTRPADAGFELGVISHYRPGTAEPHEAWADVIIVQGHAIALFPVLASTEKVLVVDIYDPMHLEQLEQGRELGTEVWSEQVRSATASLNHQLLLGDFFVCASALQRHFWIGQLAGLGRINPLTYAQENDLERLIGVVPFGIPGVDPVQKRSAIRGVVPGIGHDDKVVIWAGGIYNWFDPETLVRAVGVLAERHTDVRLFFLGVKHPNPDVPEMDVVGRTKALSAELGLTDRNVFFNEAWVDFSERADYLMDADVGVSTHFQHIESTYSFRTRILDYLWAGLPIVSTAGDTFATLVSEKSLGRSVPERDVEALAIALEAMLYDEDAASEARVNIAVEREAFRWEHAVAPLVQFCRAPTHAADRDRRIPPPSLTSIPYPLYPQRAGVSGQMSRLFFHLRTGGPRVVVAKVRGRIARRRRGGQK